MPHNRNRLMRCLLPVSQGGLASRMRSMVFYEKGYPFSICEDIITPETELVTAWYLMRTKKRENHVSVYQHYIHCCKEHGVPDIQRTLDDLSMDMREDIAYHGK